MSKQLEKNKQQFFVSCALGNEKILLQEMEEFSAHLVMPDQQPYLDRINVLEVDRGGVLVECDMFIGFQINLYSKVANRVLWRLASFQTQRLERLLEKIEKVIKERHLEKNAFQFQITCERSTLYHEARLKEALDKKWKGEKPCSLYLRIFENQCTLSFDTTGIHLHKRGFSLAKGEAPLRETLAATMVRSLFQGISRNHLESSTLIDPCCGSGTLLLESLSQFSLNQRAFDFQNLSMCPAYLKEKFLQNRHQGHELVNFQKIRGYDLDKDAIRAAEQNIHRLKSLNQTTAVDVEFICCNSLQVTPDSKSSLGATFLISNLPYGKRVKTEIPPEEMVLEYHRIFSPFRSCWMSSQELQTPPQMKKILQRKLNNQGLGVHLTVFQSENG